jgi:hypothetical protein
MQNCPNLIFQHQENKELYHFWAAMGAFDQASSNYAPSGALVCFGELLYLVEKGVRFTSRRYNRCYIGSRSLPRNRDDIRIPIRVRTHLHQGLHNLVSECGAMELSQVTDD